MVKNKFWLGLFSIPFVLVACASTWPYTSYVLDADDYRGTLRAKKEKDDLPLAVCEPDEADKGKCIVFLREEVNRMVQERIELLERLKACEEGG